MQKSFILKYLKPYTKHCIIAPFFKFIEAVLELYLPLIMAKVIDKGILKGDVGYVLSMGGFMFAIITVGLICSLICQYVASVTSQGYGTLLRDAVFKHINRLSHSQIDRFGIPSLVNRVTGDIQQLQYAVAMLLRLVVRAPFLCIGGIIMAASIDLWLSVVVLVAIPIFILIIVLVMKSTIRLHNIVQKRLDKLALILRENLSGVRVIRAFARIAGENKRFSSAAQEHAVFSLKTGLISSLLSPATHIIMNFAIIAIVWFGGVRIQIGEMTTGGVIAFINYVNMILLALIVVSNLVITFTKAYASALRVDQVLGASPDVQSAENHGVTTTESTAVEFSHVFFSYNSKQAGQDNLHDINVKIPKGWIVGIIGGTGSGKSTLINLLMRFYDVREGKTLINGIDIRDYNINQLRATIGVVPQKTELFTGTVADNIRWGKQDATDEEVRSAAKAAQASEFIERMADQYNTKIERDGTNLSGGQRQRLAIARALVRKPEILILDDSSSALDYATDAALRRSLRSYIHESNGERTVFLVSQRVSTVQNADLILVMDDGRLVGTGVHEELLESCEVYREICSSQIDGGTAQ